LFCAGRRFRENNCVWGCLYSGKFWISYSHIWRNLGILIEFWVFFLLIYLFATALNIPTSENVESLLFLRGRKSKSYSVTGLPHTGTSSYQITSSQQSQSDMRITVLPKTRTFSWRDVTYDIGSKSKRKRLLDNVYGYADAGTLTTLMDVSGADKTTLLDALAKEAIDWSCWRRVGD
jgi:ATP-binding cassette, subfamily G (WHITE), member 2, PDR